MTAPIDAPVTHTDRARNIDIWKDAEVYVAAEGVDNPLFNADGTPVEGDWVFVGLLNGGSSIGQEMDVNRTEVNSFGSVLQLTDKRVKKDARTFEALESNEVTHQLIWPGSKYVEDGAGVLLVPENDAERHVAFRTRNSFGDLLVDISRRPATIYPGAFDKNDEGAATTQFTADVKVDDSVTPHAMYDRIRVKAGEAVTEAPELIRVAGLGANASPDPVEPEGDDTSEPEGT